MVLYFLIVLNQVYHFHVLIDNNYYISTGIDDIRGSLFIIDINKLNYNYNDIIIPCEIIPCEKIIKKY